MADESGFEIGGTIYPIPPLDTFTMAEAQVLYDTCGVGLEEFLGLDDGDEESARKLKNPGVIRALIQVAYSRGNPDAKPADAIRVAGAVNWQDAVIGLLKAGREDDALPPESTTEPAPSSPNGSVGSQQSSGDGSTNGSAQPDNLPTPIGALRSATSPTSPQAQELTGSPA